MIADSGVSDAGLITTAFPAASAGPTLCATRFSGKLNGLIATTTPTGTRIVKPNLVALPGEASSGIVSPYSRLASSADHDNVWMQRSTSTRASPIVLPSSCWIVRAKSSCRSRTSSTVRINAVYRSNAEIAFICLKPRFADCTARSISSMVAWGTVSIVDPSNGLVTGALAEPSTHRPPMYICAMALPPFLALTASDGGEYSPHGLATREPAV